MRSHWQKYLVYVSLAFVAYYIYTHRLSQWFEVKSYVYLSLSVVSLLLGFVFDAISWKKILEPFATTISYTEAFASTGINIFAKYIPGKVLMIVGRAAFVSKKQGEISKLSGISLYAQLLSIIAGFVIGSFALFQSTISVKLKTALCLFMVLVFIWILSEKVKQQSIYILNKFLGKSLKIIHLSAYNTIKQLPWFAAIWFFWSLGFALLRMAFFYIDKVFIMDCSGYAL